MIKWKQIKLIVIAAVFIQLIIILYNHFIGSYPIDSMLEFFVKILYGSSLTAVFIAILYYINLILIIKFNKKLTWENSEISRVAIELIVSIIISFVISTTITSISHFMFPYENGLQHNIINNFLIISVLNVIFLSILEAYYYFVEWNNTKIRAEKLEKDNISAKYNILKSQVNPHFLFNSLNVLSNLIETDSEKAQKFNDKLADMYRYILDNIDNPVITLKEELEFGKSYIELQKIRHQDKVNISININSEVLDYLIIPISLQLLLENCFKHNIISKSNQLKISIYDENDFLIVKNNYNPKNSQNTKSGIGLKNLISRYEIISEKIPLFCLKDDDYFAILPLIKSE
jgi:two-component system LytT family sensor kinase